MDWSMDGLPSVIERFFFATVQFDLRGVMEYFRLMLGSSVLIQVFFFFNLISQLLACICCVCVARVRVRFAVVAAAAAAAATASGRG